MGEGSMSGDVNTQLLGAIKTKSAVLIVGTGLSTAASGRAAVAGWVGLLQSGIETLVGAGIRDDKWAATVNTMLEGDTSFVVQAASQVGDAFKGLDASAFAKWLRTTVGSLRLANDRLAKAICALPVPVLTTNYDTLLEAASRRKTTTWKQPHEMQLVLANRSDAIAHLHGVWNEPDSIVLSSDEYSDLQRSAAAQSLQQAFGSTKSVIYIGVGDGLDDPNFTRFLEWQRATFPNSQLTSFRLCLDKEAGTLRNRHIKDNVDVVVYGRSHDELPGYLERLAEELKQAPRSASGLLLDPIGDARSTFLEEMIADVVVFHGNEISDGAAPADLFLPPVLLPVPHGQYLTERFSDDSDDALKRLNPLDDVDTPEVVLLVGDDDSGLTFAARWLAWMATDARPLLAPVYTNFTNCHDVQRPLEQLIRREANAAGYHIPKRAEIPPLALVIDDFSPFTRPISDRVLDDLNRIARGYTVICCRLGKEEDVRRRLEDRGLGVRLRYLGKLEPQDIKQLVKIVAPGNEAIADTVLSMLRDQHLPRTPSTVLQLISILAREGSLGGASASATSILDEFVDLQLGRGDPHDDSRISLDHQQRVAILEHLAERFVLEGKGGMPEAELVNSLEAILREFGWPESPSEVLRGFLDRQVLRRAGPDIVYARSSYLHLFVAKRAQKSTEFRDRILAQPLFYAPSVANYASLNRHDSVLFALVERLIDDLALESGTSGVFRELDAVEVVDPVKDSDTAPDESSRAPLVIDRPDFYLDLVDDDPPPFPSATDQNAPQILLSLEQLTLASKVFRDADQAGSVEEKEVLLGQLLQRWGAFINEVANDGGFRALFDDLSEKVRTAGERQSVFTDENWADSRLFFPAVLGFASISEFLATRRLVVALEHLVLDGLPKDQDETVVAAVFFELVVREPGWISRIEQLVQGRERLWVVRNWVLVMLIVTYVQALDRPSDAELMRLIVALVDRNGRYANGAQRKQHQKRVKGELERVRTRLTRSGTIAQLPGLAP